MNSWSLDRFLDKERLFADVCGHAVVLSLALAALLVTETVSRTIVALDWWGYLLVWFAASITFIGIAELRFTRAFARYMDLADARFPTPDLLQRGYMWVSKKADVHAWMLKSGLVVVLAVPFVAFLRTPPEESSIRQAVESAGPFLVYVFVLCSVYGIFLALLLLASLVAGLFLGKPKTGGG